MATFTMNVGIGAQQPDELNPVNDDCVTSLDVKVYVQGGTRYVNVTYTGTSVPGFGSVDYTPTSDTTYQLALPGIRTYDSNDTEYSTATITVSLTNGGPVFYSKQIFRRHNPSYC